MLVISGIFLLTSRDKGYLGNLIKGIFSNLLKGIWDTFLFTSRGIGYWYLSIQASLCIALHNTTKNSRFSRRGFRDNYVISKHRLSIIRQT